MTLVAKQFKYKPWGQRTTMKNICQTWTNILVIMLFLSSDHKILSSHVCESHSVNISTVYDPRVCPRIMITGQHPEFISDFSFPRTPVITVDCFQDDLLKWIERRQPILLKDCTFFKQALKWDLDYLVKELTEEYAVSFSSSREFLYYDSKEDYGQFRDAGWTPPYEIRYMTFQEFLAVAAELTRGNNGSHAYFQTLLLSDDQNSSVKTDLNKFDYSWLIELAFELGWSTNVINTLFVGMPNVFTQAHYDMMENLFIQVKGKKRFILFSPEQFSKLYPFPVGHPHDRQSQVDFNKPDFQKFPKFRHVDALEAILEPGDLLYLPTNWWHYVESSKNNFTVSLNFWFEEDILDRISTVIKESVSSKKPISLKPSEDLAFKRYLETLAYNVTRSLPKVREIFEDILNDRFS